MRKSKKIKNRIKRINNFLLENEIIYSQNYCNNIENIEKLNDILFNMKKISNFIIIKKIENSDIIKIFNKIIINGDYDF